tara:strand:- start:18530 stop:19732 length:1203 start_codon:yes stop_codon:yes gene_type:complete
MENKNVNNRRLFKKATEARDKLRQMGGIATMPQPQVMTQAPKQPMAGGIMASSQDLMKAAALPRPVVLPKTNQSLPMPAAQDQRPMLPPSQPIPNIAGIQQMNQPMAKPMAQVPRPMAKPMAQKPPVKKLRDGGLPRDLPLNVATPMGPAFLFNEAFKLGQKALTSKGAAELGIPVEAAELTKKDLEGDQKDVSKKIIKSELPEKDQTGDTKKDLIAAATNLGIESVPAEAEIDEINKAIAGAKLGAALAGNYVNPNTGQAIRPTAGARISSAVADSLMVSRDTETRRAKQEAELAKANIAARAKTTKLPPNLDTLVKIFAKRAETEDMSKVAENFNEQYGDNTGTQILQFLRSGSFDAPTGDPAPMTALDKARKAIEQGAPRDKVIERLEQAGIDPGGL